MKCPYCKGSKTIQGFFPVYKESVPKSKRDLVITMQCEACDGTGVIDDRYPIWKAKGERLKQARIARKETLRNFCKRTGEEPHIRSHMERGLKNPIDKYKELNAEV